VVEPVSRQTAAGSPLAALRRAHQPAQHARASRRVGTGEEGSASLELSIVFPAVLLLVLTVIQAGLYLHARNLALSAARVGLDDARLQGSSPGAGVAHAHSYLAEQNHSGLLSGITVSSVGSTATSVHMRVTAHVTSIVPGLPLTVDQDADGPVEQFTRQP